MNVVLKRDLFTLVETLGVLEVNGKTYQTIEKPWIPGDDPGEDGGEPGKSCVPEGTYSLVPHNTEKHPHTFALVNPALDVVHLPTPGKRSSILIHPANWAHELLGCIAPGRTRTRDGGAWRVNKSRDAFQEIMAALPWEMGHTIEISRATPESTK